MKIKAYLGIIFETFALISIACSGAEINTDVGIEDGSLDEILTDVQLHEPLTILLNPESLSSGIEGQLYNQIITITASGGNPPYKYFCSGYPSSAGMSTLLSGNECTVSGTPSGGYIINFMVTDSSYGVASKSLYLYVEPSNCASSRMIIVTTNQQNQVNFYIPERSEKIRQVSVVDDCGRKLNYNATVKNGSEWLDVSSSGTGIMVITANSNGKSTGDYSDIIHILSDSLESDVEVYMHVLPACEVNSSAIEPVLYRTVKLGKYLPYDIISVNDNCGGQLDYRIDSIDGEWITLPKINDNGNGNLLINYETSILPAGLYTGIINLTPFGFDQKTISIQLTVTNNPPPDIIKLTDNTRVRFKLESKEHRYFYFITASNSGDDVGVYNHTLDFDDVLEVRLEPYANAYSGGDMLVRYAGPTCDGYLPTLEELNMTWQQSVHDPGWYADYKDYKIVGYSWHPERWRDDLYYYLTEGAFETPRIGGNPHYPLGCWYILVYNDDRLQQGYTDLYISFREYAARVHGPGY